MLSRVFQSAAEQTQSVRVALGSQGRLGPKDSFAGWFSDSSSIWSKLVMDNTGATCCFLLALKDKSLQNKGVARSCPFLRLPLSSNMTDTNVIGCCSFLGASAMILYEILLCH